MHCQRIVDRDFEWFWAADGLIAFKLLIILIINQINHYNGLTHVNVLILTAY